MSARSDQQRKSLEIYCRTMAEKLNDAGYDFKKFLEVAQYKLDVPFTQQLFKDQIWRPVQISQTRLESSTKISTTDCSEIHRIVDARVAELTGCSMPWPSRFDQTERER